MRSNRSWFAVLLTFLFASAAGRAAASDVVGNWYTQTGAQVITIYKGGPEYAGSIVTQSTTGGGTITVQNSLGNFSVSGSHVHFTVSTVAYPRGMSPLMQSETYDLDLSPEGQRLIGTHELTNSMVGDKTEPITLFLRK